MKKIFFFLLLIVSINVHAQLIHGYITDLKTGERLENAHIYVLSPIKGTSSNYYGYYCLNLPSSKDSITIYCSFIGYKTKKINILSLNKKIIDFQLEPNSLLEEVVVTGEQKKESTDIVNLPIKKLELSPYVLGEIDISKSLQFLPGIGSGMEGSSGLHVRGGSPDQNMVLLDDAAIFNGAHLASLLSVFNPDAIKSYKIYKGYIPAKYGERVSSVLDIKMRDGNLNETKGVLNVGLISSGLLIEGPIVKQKFSFLISGRVFNYGILTRQTNWFQYTAVDGYNFYDLNAKLNYIKDDKNRFLISLYNGRDVSKINVSMTSDQKEYSKNIWGNTMYSVRWNHIFKPNLFSNTTLSFNKYVYRLNHIYADSLTAESESNVNIPEIRFKSDFEYNVSKHRISFGTGYTHFSYITKVQDTIQNNIKNHQVYAYLDDEYSISKNLTIHIGLRSNLNHNQDSTIFQLEPRVMLEYTFDKNSIELIYTRINQNLQYLSNQSSGKPVEYWIPTKEHIPPVTAQQYAMNFKHKLPNNKVELLLSGYYKAFKNLVWVKENQSFSGFQNLYAIQLEKGGKGKSFGFEVLLNGNFNKLTGWLGYTYSKSTRRFPEFNNGIEFPYDFDRRHNLDLFFQYKHNEKLNLSVTWEYGSGFPITLPVGIIDYTDYVFLNHTDAESDQHLLYTTKNSGRMAAYHKLDVGLNYTRVIKSGVLQWRFGINNVYNRSNPYSYNIQVVSSPTINFAGVRIGQTSLFPIMPYFGFKWEF